MTVTASDTSAAAYAALTDTTGKTEVADNGGLKFFNSASPSGSAWAGNTGAGYTVATVAKASIDTLTFSGTPLSGKTASTVVTFYVGVKGVDSVEQFATDVYELTLTPSFGS